MADISQQLAQGIDITTPLLQGVALQRQRQQDEQSLLQQQVVNQQAQAKSQQDQKNARLKGLSEQQKVFIDIGDVDSAIRLMPEIFKIGGFGEIDADKLIEANKQGQVDFVKLKTALTKITKDTQISNSQKEFGVKTILGKFSEAGSPDVTPRGVSVSPGVTGPEEQTQTASLEPLAPVPQTQPQVQPQVQPEVAGQNDISQLRDLKQKLQSIQTTSPLLQKQIDASVVRIDGEIEAKQRLIPKTTTGAEASTKTINAIHLAQTGKSFSQGTQATQQAALDEQQSRAVEVSAARAETKLGIEVKKDIAALDNTNIIVDTLDKLSSSIITAKSAGAAFKQRVALSAGALAKTNETAATFNDQKEQFTGVLSRSLGGEKGVLTDRDITRITKGLPGFGDTKKIRDFKMGTIKLLIDTAIESKKRLLRDEPQNPNINRRLNELFRDLESKQGLEKHLR